MSAAEPSTPSLLRDYVEISKPRIILLLLIVAWAAMFVADGGLPGGVAFAAVTVAGIASTAASGALNHVIERKRDRRMGRTADRPVAAGRISPLAASVYGAVMTLVAVAALAAPGLWLAAALTAGAVAYYLVVYTLILKPTTAQNIVIGGFAGSFPALIGWAAVTDSLGVGAWLLAVLVFLWTPAHFWSLALLYKEDYAAADYPMMPNVRGEVHTRRLIVAYSVLTLLCSLAFVALGLAGVLYLVAAAVLGGLLVVRAAGLRTHPEPARYRSFFLFTIQYLGILLVVLMVDRLLPVAVPFI